MPRPPKSRRIAELPTVRAFKPVGIPARNLATVELSIDELEALRLADLEGLYHGPAADGMGVSRPTFGRLLERARRKVATALLQGRMLVVEGGPVSYGAARTFECAECGWRQERPCGEPRPILCPECGRPSVYRADPVRDCGCARASGACVHRRRGRSRVDQTQAPQDSTKERAS